MFPAILTFFVEAGRTYFPYMLLVIAWFIVKGAESEKQSIDDYVKECVNYKE